VAAFLENAGIEAELDSGGKMGEFTVWIDDKLVVKKRFLRFPEKEKILAAVHQES
jgi:hypothetical protein